MTNGSRKEGPHQEVGAAPHGVAKTPNESEGLATPNEPEGVARSEFADKFNHDEWAVEYDEDVLNEAADPIRTGYERTLSWIAERARGRTPILDVGSGTGNLTQRLDAKRIVCVDISPEMSAIARRKLAGHDAEIQFVEDDLLSAAQGREVRRAAPDGYGAIVSTYALHHLTPGEKPEFFRALTDVLNPESVVLVGDLGFASREQLETHVERYRRTGREELAETVEDEFFWCLEEDLAAIAAFGFESSVEQISELSWCVELRYRPTPA